MTANTVVPGAIATQRDASQYGHIDLDAVHDRLAIKHFGAADDVAACLYLAGEGGRFVTGQAIHVSTAENSCSDQRRRPVPRPLATRSREGVDRSRRPHPDCLALSTQQVGSRPSRRLASWVRLLTPTLRKIDLRWSWTVCWEMYRAAATSRVECASRTSGTICRSRGDKP